MFTSHLLRASALSFFIGLGLRLLVAAEQDKYSPESFICKLLKAKYMEAQPWIEYPIIYEPLVRGRLTIWSGVSTLPGSELECLPANSTESVVIDLNLANFAEKFEWTFFDTRVGLTYHGITVNSRENVIYRAVINNRQSHSYLNCNTVEKIELVPSYDESPGVLRTMCRNCGHSTITLVNSLIGELIRLKLNDEIEENLRWHLNQLVASQHLSGPVPL